MTNNLLREGVIEPRLYQETIIGRAANTNLLCVLPTGLGKTPIAIVLSAIRMAKYPDSKILVLAPTKPLIEQHLGSFSRALDLPEEDFILLTGLVKPEERKEKYGSGRVILATPQTVKNDLENGLFSLADFSLVVFDEAHHAIGDYAYPFIAKMYRETGKNVRVLGLTASPGGTKEKIKEIMDNLGMEAVEIRTERDRDVEPYVKMKDVDWVYVDLPASFREVRLQLDKAYQKRLADLKKLGFSKPTRYVSKKDLLKLQVELFRSKEGGYKKFWGMSVVSQALKLEHAVNLIETQGVKPLHEYMDKLFKEKSKASVSIQKDKDVSNARFLLYDLLQKGSSHPKMGKLAEIVDRALRANKESKIIVFANYRNTVKEIAKALSGITGAKPAEFMGQKEGVTQKEQKRIIEDFRSGSYNVLVCTSVGEEGIDIPEMSLAIFYEPVPSEIRQIQRRGRVGRTKVGKIMFLITGGTRDEAYYWTAQRKEKEMHETLHGLKTEFDEFPVDETPTEEPEDFLERQRESVKREIEKAKERKIREERKRPPGQAKLEDF